MAVTVKPLSDSEKESIKRIFEGMYLHGSCYELAIALHRNLGWKMVALFVPGRENKFPHAGVRTPNRKVFDSRGPLETRKFITPFVEYGEKYEIINVTEAALRKKKVTPIKGEVIDFAATMARIVWPNLPWKSGGLEERVKKFLTELEKLSRKHKLWVYSPVPTHQPVLVRGEGDELGYEATPTHDALGYTFNRVLPGFIVTRPAKDELRVGKTRKL